MRLSRKDTIADQVVKGVLELNITANDYLLYHSERARMQWQLRYDSLSELIQNWELQIPEDRISFAEMRHHHAKLKSVFLRLSIDYEGAVMSGERLVMSKELEKKLANQLSTRSQAMISGAERSHEKSHRRAVDTHLKYNMFIILLAVIMMMLIAVAVLSLSRSIVTPIAKLRKGTQVIADGNLDYQVATDTKDEIGELSRAFDHMTARLKTITVSRDELESRVKERTSELMAANEKLRKEIEERRQTEKAKQESELKYRSLFENMFNGFAYCKIILDENNRPIDFIYLEVNDAFERLTGIRKEDVIGKKVTQAIPTIKDAHPELFEIYGNVALTGKEAGFDIYFEPIEIWLSISVYSPQKGYFVAVFDNITERKNSEKQIQKSKTMLQAVFDGISDPLILMDGNLSVKMINKAASKYYNVDVKDVAGKPCHHAFRGRTEPCEACDIPAAVLDGRSTSFERKGFMDPDRVEQVIIYPLIEKDRQAGAAIIRINDITESKLMQRQLIQSEKLNSLGFLVSGVAHEINNPNSFISFNIPILRDYLKELIPIIDDYTEKHPGFRMFEMSYPEFRQDIFGILENIEHGSNRINKTVANLREFTRMKDEIEKEWVDIKQVIEKAVALCKGKINRLIRSLEMNLLEGLPQVYTDPQNLEQVLVNLIINATQAADKEDSWIRLATRLGNTVPEKFIVEVSDNGSGMDQAIMNKVFDPFFTTKAPGEGTGLGLSICHTLIESLGGRIEVESELNKGSTFRIILPDTA